MTHYRRVIHIAAEDSPNVKLGLWEREQGREPSGRMVLEGVLPWDVYCQRRATWDKVRQCIGLDGRFYRGAEVLMYPPTWLNRAEEIARRLDESRIVRIARGVGVDTGEGVADTVWTAVDEFGLIAQRSRKTPNTASIKGETVAFLTEHQCPPERCCFDRGGGGLQVADELREMGYPVRTVPFGETLSLEPQRHKTQFGQRVEIKEERYSYKNRRAQMAHAIRLLIEPREGGEEMEGIPVNGAGGSSFSQRGARADGFALGKTPQGFGIPARFVELRRQMAPIPLLYDGEGRIWLPPKHRKEGESKDKKTLQDMLGCSPDEWDSFMLAVHAMQSRPARAEAGAF